MLLTLGLSFVIADLCLMIWTGDPIQPATPAGLTGGIRTAGMYFPWYRLAIIAIAVAVAVGLWVLIDWTRLGAMIRAGVDDAPMARVMGIQVSRLFTAVFCIGACGLCGRDGRALPVGLSGPRRRHAAARADRRDPRGAGSLIGALIGSFIIGGLYNFGQAMFPDLSYVILFLPMVLVLILRPQGLLGRVAT
ncbi:branched-chain amino acid ABC transporter permease [Micromonospora sp. STR1s_5]|nr:branched-chain amino acid ABC transporter permease [Micromonospora sp. STR1s_5]